MEKYKNIHGKSGVLSYEILDYSIVIEFEEGGIYLYDYENTGEDNIEIMKELAKAGMGLATFINKNVRGNYAKKIV